MIAVFFTNGYFLAELRLHRQIHYFTKTNTNA